ncbi:MAG TPA: hypothetical protein VN442_15870 [Bryobacteraceae bacterium]|nr:hypothetical protein [Bryobacteraceae bacterium]
MIDTSVLVNNLVAILRDIPELVVEMGGEESRIYAYHDQYPKNISLTHAIHSMPAPSIMAVWQGTGPGSFGGFDVWKHQVTLFLRARETLAGVGAKHLTRNIFHGFSEDVPGSNMFEQVVTERYDSLLFVEKTTAARPNAKLE